MAAMRVGLIERKKLNSGTVSTLRDELRMQQQRLQNVAGEHKKMTQSDINALNAHMNEHIKDDYIYIYSCNCITLLPQRLASSRLPVKFV